MKMLVSDYDDTFYINEQDIKKNILAVTKFMKNNYFVIATGRSYLDYQDKADQYGITCNYLIINHGATILKNGNIIYNKIIDNTIKNELIKDLKLENATYSFACSGKESRTSFNRDNLTKIHVRYHDSTEAKKINDILIQKYLNKISSFLVYEDQAIEIVSKEVNKAEAINFIARLEKISKNNIYTIGDSYSDIEMIKSFKGYAMMNSIKELKDIAIKQYQSVSNLILTIMEDSNVETQ